VERLIKQKNVKSDKTEIFMGIRNVEKGIRDVEKGIRDVEKGIRDVEKLVQFYVQI
jgi:hypothetical protein